MKCPFCGLDNTRVIDSRPADDNSSIRRRRLCDECGKRFTTYERVEIMPLTVIKKDKTREPYDRSKIMSGILRACHKRPISVEQIEQMVNQIENELFNLEYKEIESKQIGEVVMEHLKTLEQVAYVRFASVYREFKDVGTFMNELKKMLVERTSRSNNIDKQNRYLRKYSRYLFFVLKKVPQGYVRSLSLFHTFVNEKNYCKYGKYML